MTAFSVDAAGMNGIYNQLLHFADTADHAKKKVDAETDMQFYERGLIEMLLTGKEHAYDDANDLLSTLSSTFRDVATEINQVQRYYTGADSASAAKLDATYTGARDKSATRANPEPEKGGHNPTPFADADDADAKIDRAPTHEANTSQYQADLLTDLTSPSAAVRQAAQWIFHTDPFVAWLEWATGDWAKYEQVGTVWKYLGQWLDAVAANVTRLAGDVPHVWTGNAAEAFQQYLVDLATSLRKAEANFEHYHKLFFTAADGARNLFDRVSSPLGDLCDALLIASVAFAAGEYSVESVIGPVVGWTTAGMFAADALIFYKEISDLYGDAKDVFASANGITKTIEGSKNLRNPTVSHYRHPAVR